MKRRLAILMAVLMAAPFLAQPYVWRHGADAGVGFQFGRYALFADWLASGGCFGMGLHTPRGQVPAALVIDYRTPAVWVQAPRAYEGG